MKKYRKGKQIRSLIELFVINEIYVDDEFFDLDGLMRKYKKGNSINSFLELMS